MIRVGLAGAGLIGRHHADALSALRSAGLADVAVTHVLDRDRARAEAFATDVGARTVPNADSLAAEVDAVWVCTWTSGHLELVEAATRAERPVFCEKPLAATWEDCVRMAESLDAVPHQVGLILRFSPAYRFIAGAVESGRYGRPMAASFRDDQCFPVGGTYGSTWRADPSLAGGGTLLEHSIHDADVLSWILGSPTEVAARTAGFAGHSGIEDLAAVTLAYEGGLAATLTSVWHRVPPRTTNRRLEVFCEDAVIWLDGEVGEVHVESATGRVAHDTGLPEPMGRLDLDPVRPDWRFAVAAFAVEAKAFLDRLVDADRPSGPGVREALVAHSIVEAAYRSAAAGGAPLPTPALPKLASGSAGGSGLVGPRR